MALLTRTDVTAVKLCQNFIVAAIGSFLEVFQKESGKFIQKLSALRGQNIYGIVPPTNGAKLLIFGGKQFAVMLFKNNWVHVDENTIICHHIEPIICNDWLHSVIWLSGDNVALLTAHNVVQIWNTEIKQLTQQHVCPDNSILYSGLLLSLNNNILIFSGTVYSEVIIHWCGDESPLQYLKGHKGVIFSITCDPQRGVIVTTSDDRSVRIWNTQSISSEYICKDFWINANIICTHELYGHSARVMRSSITTHYIISGGEDSGICFWDHEGKLLKKVMLHQNACVWSIDADDEYLVTGGSDSSVVLHPLSLLTDYGQCEVVDIDIGNPKKVQFTARGNLVIVNESNELIYYDFISKIIHMTKLNHNSTFKILSLSPCKQIIAVADMTGTLDVFIENCKGYPEIRNIINKGLQIGKILSMHWVSNRHLVLCSDNGIITVLASKENDTEIIATFILPLCKERWITAGCLSYNKEILVIGDRCGHIHIYFSGIKNPIKTFDRVHGRYGATSITIQNNKVVTTGRDGKIKYLSINKDNVNDIKYLSCKDLEFQWVEKFLDKTYNYICGFQERIFVVHDVKNNMKVLEVNCGGGHRSWDAIRYFDKVHKKSEEFIRLVYLKNSAVLLHTFQLSKIVSKNIVHGTHSKEINCLKTYISENDEFTTFYITGGEDTTLRVSSSYQDTFKDVVIFKQLSNVRCLKVFPLETNKILLISAGGRAQICAKAITFNKDDGGFDICSEEIVDYMIKGTDKERRGNRNWKNCSIDFDPETRVMDLDIVEIDVNKFITFAGCSDGVLRVFNFENAAPVEFAMVQEIKHHKTCILKLHVFKILGKDVLATCTTRGEVALWDISSCLELSDPIFSMQTNQSGINCIDVKTIDHGCYLIATGGDDNAIHLNIIRVDDDSLKSIQISHSWSTDGFHCSQVTGLKLIDKLMLSTGIDQRVTLSKWSLADGLDCVLVSQYFTDVADIQGLDIMTCSQSTIKVCVFGKGIQVLEIPRNENM